MRYMIIVKATPESEVATEPAPGEALLAAIPEHSKGAERLQTLPGVVPGAWDRPAGCLLGPRCPFARPDCHAKRPSLVTTPQGESRCYYPLAYPEVV